MHLDTVFTMVDKDAFTIFPTVIKVLKVWEMDYDDNGTLLSIKRCHHWKEAIAQELGFDTIRVIEMRGKDQAETDREQWRRLQYAGGRPGKVVTIMGTSCPTGCSGRTASRSWNLTVLNSAGEGEAQDA